MPVQRFECKHSAGRRRKPDGAVYKSGFDRIHADDCKSPNSLLSHIKDKFPSCFRQGQQLVARLIGEDLEINY